MPEYKRRKVIIEVEFQVDGSGSWGECADQSVKPVKAIAGAKIKSVRIEDR